MKCTTVKQLLPEYIEESLSRRQNLAVAAHLAGCEHCMSALQGCKEQLDGLTRSLKSAADPCPEYPDLAEHVLLALQKTSADTTQSPLRIHFSLRSSFSFAALAAITALAAVLFFQGIISSTSQCAPELRSGRQLAFTAQPRGDGRVDSGITTRRFARIQSAESGWPR